MRLTKQIPVDMKGITDLIYGQHSDNKSGYVREEEIRLRAYECELLKLPEEDKNYRTFKNIKKGRCNE